MTTAQLNLLILVAEELMRKFGGNPHGYNALAAALSAVQREQEHPAEAR